MAMSDLCFFAAKHNLDGNVKSRFLNLLLIAIVFSLWKTFLIPNLLWAAVPQKEPSLNVAIRGEEVTFHWEGWEKSHISEQIVVGGETRLLWRLPDEGWTNEPGKPVLPMVSRFVLVPPQGTVSLNIIGDEAVHLSDLPPPLLGDEPSQIEASRSINIASSPEIGLRDTSIYPFPTVQLSSPIVFRGFRLVKVTVFPIQYDLNNGIYIYHRKLDFEVLSNQDEVGENEVHLPLPRVINLWTRKFIQEIAVNADQWLRDTPEEELPLPGHYLIIAHQSALLWHLPFTEWRRKMGYKVDVYAVPPNQAGNPEAIRDEIRNRYNAYRQNGQEPFDHILIIGDRTTYDNRTAAPQHIITPFTGNSIWGSGGPHADYAFGLLEGNDNWPDVAVSRFPSGSQSVANLVVNRTLAYIATPRMQNPEWFLRGAAYSQHWGNSATSAWHVTIPTNVRWAEEVLKNLGFNDVAFYENYQWDRMGDAIGPFLRDQLNRGVNLLLGRAENYYWRDNFQGVNNNSVFPIKICLSGHGEWAAYNMFRTGDGNNLKGPVAITFGWGGPPTAPNSYMWLEMVNATLNKDFTLGWARTLAITKIERYFPNINVGRNLYDHVKTDVDIFGDPAIQPWIGIPTQVNVTYPSTITPNTKSVILTVRDQRGSPVVGAIATLYAPGRIPTNDPAQYANWDNITQINLFTDSDGVARFILPPDFQFEANTRVYLTVSGRKIRPWNVEITVTTPLKWIDVSVQEFEEIEGNGDDAFNPGEVWRIFPVARNLGNRNAVENLWAEVFSHSPYLVLSGDTLNFGTINPGESGRSEESITIEILNEAPDSRHRPFTIPTVDLVFHSGNETWQSAFSIPISAPSLELNQIIGGAVIGYNAQNITLELINRGSISSPSLTAQLRPLGMGINVINSRTSYPIIAPGRAARPNGNILTVVANRLAVPGTQTPMALILTFPNGASDTIIFNLQCSQPRQNAPQGPDNYGYICFDDTDTDWDMAPRYQWVEISTREQNRTFNGTLINFRSPSPTDTGEVRVIDLPFETQFYGRIYNRITVSTNGYIAMGAQPRVNNFQNWPLDQGIGGGVGMIAPYWDDIRLDQNANSGIYYYYDRNNARFIVEWYKMKPSSGNNNYTFQVILYDRRVWITETGDQNILFQYREMNPERNIRAGDSEWINNIPWASVGISSPDGKTGISYVFKNEYPITSAPLQNQRALLFTTSPQFRSGTLMGRVSDAASGRPISGATVFTHHGFTATTNAQGYWIIENALAEVRFNITAQMEGYNDSTLTDLMLRENDTLTINFSLLHPEFALNVDSLVAILLPEETRELEFQISNRGNGPLYWHAEKRLIGEANAEPWENRRSYPIGEAVNDDRLEGVAFDGNYFYIAGAAGDNPNTIYVVNRAGEIVNNFEQPGQSIYGMRDLEWDGELLWGSGERNIYGFTTEGEVRVQFRGPFDPNYAIAYDSEQNILWIANLTSDIYAYDREGNFLNRIIPRRGLRFYGLAYFPEDPQGYKLYSVHRSGGPILIYKFNTQNGDSLLATTIDIPNASSANGIYITNQYDIYSWVLLTIANVPRVQGGDRVEVYQLDSRRDWFQLDAYTGTIPQEENRTLTLTFNSSNLPEAIFRGEIVFTHNAQGRQFILPITLYVRESGPRDIRVLDLRQGWNIVSLNIAPAESLLTALVQPLLNAGILMMVKDGRGRFFRPTPPFNNIPYWDARQGYQIYLTENFRWSVLGTAIPADSTIPLTEGWNLVSYLPRVSLPAPLALRSIEHHLVVAKDPNGRFYLPEFEFSNMENMREGRGYFIKVIDEAELIYPIGQDGAQLLSNETFASPRHFINKTFSGSNFSLLILCSSQLKGWEIGVKDRRGVLRGGGVVDPQGRCGIAVWEMADDDTIKDSSPLFLVAWDGNREINLAGDPVVGNLIWEKDGWAVIKINDDNLIPGQLTLYELYPNPFNNTIRFSIGLPSSQRALKITIYDSRGAMVRQAVHSSLSAGIHHFTWTLSDLPGGIYFLRLEHESQRVISKLLLIK